VTDTAIAPIEGEVVNTAEGSAEVRKAMLKENETVIRKNWKVLEEKGQNVYRALTIIHSFNLWKLHTDAKGKRKYTNFETYLSQEFGWTLSRVRALQVIKATRAQMIESGELPASTAQSRTRTAPEVTSERAAKVTSAQLVKVLEAFEVRVNNIDEGDPDKAEMVRIFGDAAESINAIVSDLDEIVARNAADAETDADEDEDESEDDAS
jgi:hypothetical protein